ncbi:MULTISPECIES: cytochrome c oxidase subunit 2A [unclassified Acidiphilium]|uniref:cytochrome c oxidase subunit 2A n=1 Tax=unclassified Acidiphilium TaxID=2617493 RepID=UPI000BD28542|nr:MULTISPECIES: cytochrome c oxidase subunit 2A [unclassified Acidiphilium]OZB21716.1 MAG: hypothetical protein B7X49_17570 [Acidiphilium sp. 34-64-41]
MSDNFSEPNPVVNSSDAEIRLTRHEKPRGAILIATILGLTILAVWFGLYLISAMRYTP